MAVARMIGQHAVPKCDGPILLPLDVLTCRVGTLSLKAHRGHGLLPQCPKVQLLCSMVLIPQRLQGSLMSIPIEAWRAITAEVSCS